MLGSARTGLIVAVTGGAVLLGLAFLCAPHERTQLNHAPSSPSQAGVSSHSVTAAPSAVSGDVNLSRPDTHDAQGEENTRPDNAEPSVDTNSSVGDSSGFAPLPRSAYDSDGRLLNPETYFDTPSWGEALHQAMFQVRATGDLRLLKAMLDFYARSKGNTRAYILQNLWNTERAEAIEFVLQQYADPYQEVRYMIITVAAELTPASRGFYLPAQLVGSHQDTGSVSQVHLQLIERCAGVLQRMQVSDPDSGVKIHAQEILKRLDDAAWQLRAGAPYEAEREKGPR